MTGPRLPRYDLSVGQRLTVGFGAAGLLLAVLVALSLAWVDRVTELRAQLERVIAPRAAAGDALEAAVFRSGIAARTAVITRDPRDADAFQRSVAEVRQSLDRLAALTQGPVSRPLLEEIRARLERYVSAGQALVAAAHGGEGVGQAERAVSAARDDLLDAVRTYLARQEQRTVEARDEIGAAVRRLERGLLLLAPMVVALLALTAVLTTRSVRDPALALLRAARALEAGDDGPALALAAGASLHGRRDELAELSAAFGSMAAALRARGERLQEQNQELQAQGEELQLQQEELQSQNEELHAQGDELQAQAHELRRALEALGASEERFRRAVVNAPFPIMIHSDDGRVHMLSRAWTELSGWSPEEIPTLGAWIEKAHHPAHAAEYQARIRELYALDTQRDSGEITVRTRDGRERIWTFASASLGEQDGRRLVVSMANDVTDRKRAEDAVRDASRRKDEFLATLSHELRNPLAPIRNGLYLLDRSPPGSETARRARAAMDRQLRHLTRLVDDLLDVTRISRGKVQLRRVGVNLGQIVDEVADDVREQFAASGIDFVVSVPSRRLWVNGDPARLAQVIGNLLHNALKFTAPGGRVDLQLEEAPDGCGAVLRVRDTGVGIDPELLERIFEPFVQGDATLARTQGGLGLGLALVKALVEYHGGTVEARSDGPDTGAELLVRLPLEPEPVRAVSPPTAGGVAPRRILVVEDNLDAAETMGELLRLDGHEVTVALEGEEALRRARDLRPDAILCDIGLPGMTGYEVARAIRRDEALRGVVLVALTGYALPEDRRQGVEAGFDEYVAKPLSREQLQQILARVPARAAAGPVAVSVPPLRGDAG